MVLPLENACSRISGIYGGFSMTHADMESAHGAPIAISARQAAGRVNGVNPCVCDPISHDGALDHFTARKFPERCDARQQEKCRSLCGNKILKRNDFPARFGRNHKLI